MSDLPAAYCHTCEEYVGTAGSMRKASNSKRTHRSLNGLHHEVEIHFVGDERERTNEYSGENDD